MAHPHREAVQAAIVALLVRLAPELLVLVAVLAVRDLETRPVLVDTVTNLNAHAAAGNSDAVVPGGPEVLARGLVAGPELEVVAGVGVDGVEAVHVVVAVLDLAVLEE